MQLIDALLWYDATLGPMESCDMLNRVITRLGICIICCEPLAALWGAYRISGRKHPPNALIALYVSVFLLTPLAGASVLALGDETIEGACQSPLVAPEERVLPCDGRSTCRALFDVSTPVVCSTITPQHHIQVRPCSCSSAGRVPVYMSANLSLASAVWGPRRGLPSSADSDGSDGHLPSSVRDGDQHCLPWQS
eukprot:scaffold3674_cov371-Prasinococcus_capsulatus_cf.AAC.3